MSDQDSKAVEQRKNTIEQGVRLLLEPAMKKSTTQNKSVFLARLGFTREEILFALRQAQSRDFETKAMSVKLENFNTDFTRFLEDKIPHTVKLVTDHEVIECSGVILAQHSDTLKDMIKMDCEVFLLDYQFVSELLTLLHGGSVALSLENCVEFVKFACQFNLPGVVDQVFSFIASTVDSSNVVQCVKNCVGTKKVADFHGNGGLDSDVLWPCEDVLDKMSSEEVKELVNNFQPDEVFAMFVNRIFVKKLLPVCSSLITQSNVESILDALFFNEDFDFIESAAQCPEPEIITFFEAFETMSLSVKSFKLLNNLKRSVLKEVSMGALAAQVTPSSSDHDQQFLKNWKTFTVDQMFQICKLGINQFYLSEIILSWVSLNKPSLWTVKRLCSLINPARLTSPYLQHVQNVIRGLGYNAVSLEKEKGKIYVSLDVCPRFETRTSIEIKDLKIGPTISMNFRHYYNGTSKIDIERFGKVSMWCSESNEGKSPISGRGVYGTTAEGTHIPFYTDPSAAVWLLATDGTIMHSTCI